MEGEMDNAYICSMLEMGLKTETTLQHVNLKELQACINEL